MSHLARIIAYREHLTSLGVTCPIEQSSFCEEAFIRALVSNQVKYTGILHFDDNTENDVWTQLDKWNSVSPIKAGLIVETARLRLARVRQGLIAEGKTPGNEEFAVQAQVTQEVEGEQVTKNICVTGNDQFKNLFDYLCVELREGRE